jgi:hypothetical protein
VPVVSTFMDLPLMTGSEDPIAPHVAVSSDPWPGSVAVYDAAQDDGYGLNSVLYERAVIGVTETDLSAAQVGLMDRGAPLEVNLSSGTLESVSEEQLLAGANLMAIGDGSPGNWELFQFQQATLLDGNRWQLSQRLRGQAGTDGAMPAVWPAGSKVVLMNGAPQQIDLTSANRRVARHYRIGPGDRPYSDPTYSHAIHAFDGNGLRPYRPAHVRLVDVGGDLQVSWIRRTRLDGDSWELYEVPLSEDSESYLVRVKNGAQVLREEQVSSPNWTYVAADQAADGYGLGCTVEVAQISAQYGPGLFAEAEVF